MSDLELPAVSEHSTVQIRERGGKLTILLTLHSARCAGCRAYIDSVAAISNEFEVWDARLLVIVPGPPHAARATHVPFGTLLSRVPLA